MKGDMISRSAIKDQFEEYIAVGDKRFVEGMFHFRNIVLDAIDNAPTVAAAPEVHGRWEEIYDPYGELEEWIHGECGRCSKEKSPYCPNCGARMDGGEGE